MGVVDWRANRFRSWEKERLLLRMKRFLVS